MNDPIQQLNHNPNSCSVCAGVLVPIRGRFPEQKDRIVCPTCLAERMDMICEMSSHDYGKAFQSESLPKKI